MSTVEEIRDMIRAAGTVVTAGGGTHRAVGGAIDERRAPRAVVRAPAGVRAFHPADMTVAVAAGTQVGELDAALAEAGQECPLDPADRRATVGGVLACGLSGHRRLRHGPLRDRVLEVRFVTGDGRAVRGGGPTVKNVTGYDVPRLMVGSLGTLGVLTEVTLRTQPRPEHAGWFVTGADPDTVRKRLHRPACIAWDGAATWIRLEGHAADVGAEAKGAHLAPSAGAPPWPGHPHRGRISVPPAQLREVAGRLGTAGIAFVAEVGVGTVHVGTGSEPDLAAARALAHAHGGWLLREAGAPGLDPFGVALPDAALHARLKRALDPEGKLNPGRVPYDPAP